MEEFAKRQESLNIHYFCFKNVIGQKNYKIKGNVGHFILADRAVRRRRKVADNSFDRVWGGEVQGQICARAYFLQE